MNDRDRYRNHTYSESRDRGRREHAEDCPHCGYVKDWCHCNWSD